MPLSKTILQTSAPIELDGVLQQPVALTGAPHSRGREALVAQMRSTEWIRCTYCSCPGRGRRGDWKRMSMVALQLPRALALVKMDFLILHNAEHGSGYGLDPAAANGASAQVTSRGRKK